MSGIDTIAKYYTKAEQYVIANKSKFLRRDFSINVPPMDRHLLSLEQQADLGTAALFIEETGKKFFKSSSKQVKDIYGNLKSVEKTEHRSKGVQSIWSKLKKYLERAKGYFCQEQTFAMIEDLEGSRVFLKPLKKLNKKEIDKMIDNLKIKGQPISEEQKVLLRKYINAEKITPEQEVEIFPIFEKFAAPLIEKRSEEVVNATCLSIAKNRIMKNEITLDEIKEKGMLSEKLIKILEKNYDKIQSLEVVSIDNYRGMHGLPVFTNNQIAKIRDIAGSKIIIHSRPDLLDYPRYNVSAYTKDELKQCAIKESGYRTAQMKIVHNNGVRGEIQITSSDDLKIYNPDHMRYDTMQGKSDNLIFSEKYKQLDDNDKKEYERYWENCFNHAGRQGIGLPSSQPTLPKRFNEMFSFENFEDLHKSTTRKAKNTTYNPHFGELIEVA